MKQKIQIKLISIVLTTLALAACQSKPVVKRSDALWNIVSQKCVPKHLQNVLPEPCDEVSFVKGAENGYVVLKDLNGPLQYLLMPTAKITGVESPELLKTNSPNYFYESWVARSYMVKKYGAAIDDEEISLAINSQQGRSQNQLHVHISCIRPDVKKIIQDHSTKITEKWTHLPVKILGHDYKVIKITAADLKSKNIFDLVAKDIPDGEQNLSKYGIGLMALKNKKNSYDYVLLTSRAELPFNRGSVEEIQDHLCPQLSAELLKKAGQGRK
ncbi:MAG: CDP-diacylglycerol diphosphatase [Pseudobdellovibrio sp.]